ncbi:hypothetical protein GBA52_014244 [Prunus armeniaca]|nr:hypothetical protein GBA52_014244 [Prunus armeniaca]
MPREAYVLGRNVFPVLPTYHSPSPEIPYSYFLSQNLSPPIQFGIPFQTHPHLLSSLHSRPRFSITYPRATPLRLRCNLMVIMVSHVGHVNKQAQEHRLWRFWVAGVVVRLEGGGG